MCRACGSRKTLLVQLLKDLHQKIDERPLGLHSDNQSAIQLGENLVFHLEVHNRFVLEKLLRGKIEMKFTRKDEQADIFTKRLIGSEFVEFRKKLGMASSRTVVAADGSIRKLPLTKAT